MQKLGQKFISVFFPAYGLRVRRQQARRQCVPDEHRQVRPQREQEALR